MNLNEQDPQPVEHEYRIPLTQGQFALVDAEDFQFLSQWKWFARWDKRAKCWYAMRNKRIGEGKRGLVYMHRAVMRAPDGFKVDHHDQQTLNNRRYNLRLATTSQNGFNRGKASHNKSGFKGVKWVAHAKKWCARITVRGKIIHLGYFVDPAVASEVYKAAAVKHHGEFAKW